jgi:hypothetical protein
MITTIVRKNDRNKLYGLIVSESNRLILLKREYDFQFDGYQIIRKVDIKEMYSSDSNAYCVKLMKNENIWNSRHPNWVRKLDLTCWQSVFNGIKCKAVIVENEIVKGGFYIGPILKVTKSNVTIQWFDGIGKFGSPDVVNYKIITTCKFLDRYSVIHSKYLKSAQQGDAPEPASPAR